MESVADDVCGHARAAFIALRENTIQVAERMALCDIETFEKHVCEATGKGMLSKEDGRTLVEMANNAELVGVPPLVRIGGTGYFAVRENVGRTVEHRWAHVKKDDKKDDNQETRLMCKVMARAEMFDVGTCVLDLCLIRCLSALSLSISIS